MYENSNKGIIKDIAKGTMKVHRLRNVMACLAIALTAVLITLVCGAGVSTVQAIMTEAQMNPAPGTNGAGITGGPELLEKVRKQPEVEWADIARLCMLGTPGNLEFAGNTVKFLAVDEGYYGHHYVDLICGEYPQNAGEILMSDTLAEESGREMEPGQKMTINLVVEENGERVEKPVEVTISGFYNNPLRAIEDYEEIYTTEDFPDIYNPELGDDGSVIYTKLAGVTNQTPTAERAEKLESLNEAVGGNGIVMVTTQDFTMVFLGGAALLVLFIVYGYILIYNIFYISVVNDIRFMGSMKTIGMTGKQIRAMLNYQVRRLGALGILAGVFAGTGLNILVIRLLAVSEFSFSRYYEAGISLLWAALAGAVFAAGTVWISSRKALSLAAKVSPVEAARFRTTGRKKTVFAVLSFALSGILFCALYTALVGYDTQWMADRMNEADYKVYQYHAEQLMDDPYIPMDIDFAERAASVDFADESYIYYRAADLEQKPDNGVYGESCGRVSAEGRTREILERDLGLDPEKADETEEPQEKQRERLDGTGGSETGFETGILGMETDALPMEAEHLNVYDGELDAEKFAEGGYLIYQPVDASFAGEGYQYEGFRAGEEITLSFYNASSDSYIERTFTLLAVVGGKPDNYAGEIVPTIQFIISDAAFREIYGDLADQMVSSILINTSGNEEAAYQEELEEMVKNSLNTQIRVTSKYETRLSEEVQKTQKVCIGIFVGVIVGLIGMANIVNTLVTGVLSRKLEYAALQSIGMTKRQMAWDIFSQGIKMILISFLLILPIGLSVTRLVSQYPISTGFVPSLYALSLCMAAAAGTGLAAAAACILTKSLNKKTVVERLREAE